MRERWEKNPFSRSDRVRYGRGHAPAVYRWRETGRGPGGGRPEAGEFRFDTWEMTDPLRDAVLGAGWIWRGVLKF